MPKTRSRGDDRPCLMIGRRADGPVAKILIDAGYQIEAVGTEPEARTALDLKRWTAVFAGQGLGKTALQSLIVHAAQARPGLPVVVVGSTASLQEAVDAMQLGAADFLAPPFEAETVLARL